MRLATALAVLAGLCVSTAASAQAYRCAVPVAVGDAAAPAFDASTRHIAPVASYTLALSWSPGFCRRAGGRQGFQCDGANRFGFILHGLWPEASGARWPQYCLPPRRIPAAVVRQTLCAMPSPGLQAHQYAKHGSCTGMSPSAYFDRARSLYAAVNYPDMNVLSRRRGLTAGQFAALFARANPGLSPAMLRVRTNREGWLEEVRLCLDTRFRPRICPAHQRGATISAPLRIWRGS